MRDGPDPTELLAVLRDPARATGLSARNWNSVLLAARKYALAARLESELERRGLLEQAPPKARRHLRALAIACESTHTAIRFELDRVRRALELSGVDCPVTVLKGAGYLVAGLAAARGRFIGDLDLMVPLERIEEVEAALTKSGWEAAEVDEYDQRYYREWMHEVPPLQHPQRQTPVDLHHTILPRTGRVQPDAAALHAAAVPVSTRPLKVLAPADMLLHGAVHLFNGESSHRLRDLIDQQNLMEEFSADPSFWGVLLERAALHGLGRTLYYSLRYSRRILGAEVPEQVRVAAEAWRPGPPVRWLMDRLIPAHLLSTGAKGGNAWTSFANGLLLVRSHWLKMPPAMLARHLRVKAMKRLLAWTQRRGSQDEVPGQG